MSDEQQTCDTHAWASVGVVIEEGAVTRIWECENCPVWTREVFAPGFERSWDDTWLAER